MAMPQRDDTIEAIRHWAAEKKAAEEKKKAEARARAAYRRKQRKFEENGLLEGFVQINWSFMAARGELKRRGFCWGEEGMGQSPAPVQTPRTVALSRAWMSVVWYNIAKGKAITLDELQELTVLSFAEVVSP